MLVLAVLAGMLAMHALAPSGMPSMDGPITMGASAPAHGDASRAAVAGHPEADREHPGGPGAGAGTGGMVHHADATCAAAGTSTGYVPPALAPDTLLPTAFAGPVPEGPAGDTDGRAPPDLAQLQLLRI
jgi:hypothetical protein